METTTEKTTNKNKITIDNSTKPEKEAKVPKQKEPHSVCKVTKDSPFECIVLSVCPSFENAVSYRKKIVKEKIGKKHSVPTTEFDPESYRIFPTTTLDKMIKK